MIDYNLYLMKKADSTISRHYKNLHKSYNLIKLISFSLHHFPLLLVSEVPIEKVPNSKFSVSKSLLSIFAEIIFIA